MGASVREVVRRGQAQRLLQLRRPPRRGRERRQGRVLLGGRARRRAARDHLRRPPAGGRALRQRAEDARRRQRHAGRDLHGHGPRAPGGHARVHAPRCAAHGRLRWVQRRRALRPTERHGLRGADHPRRGLAQGHPRPAEGKRRRGARREPRRPERRRPPSDRRRARAGRGPRRCLGRPRRRRARRGRDMPVRADGLGGPPLPSLHERHDREAEGDRAHDSRLPRRRRLDAPLHLRREARLGLLVRGRHRLGDRPQLHRLRAPLQRDDLGAVRGHARLPRPRPLVGDRRALQGGRPLHGADRDPRPHEVGPGARAEARHVVVATARERGRADQPRGVDVVPRAHRRRAHAGRRHLVADGDRNDPHQPAARDHDREARLGDQDPSRESTRPWWTSPARKCRSATAATSSCAARGPRCCAGSTRITSASSRHTGAASRAPTSRATAPSATTTATSG